jgi:hypothetical protein
VNEKIQDYGTNWLDHLGRTDEECTTKKIFKYIPQGRRNVRRSRSKGSINSNSNWEGMDQWTYTLKMMMTTVVVTMATDNHYQK